MFPLYTVWCRIISKKPREPWCLVNVYHSRAVAMEKLASCRKERFFTSNIRVYSYKMVEYGPVK